MQHPAAVFATGVDRCSTILLGIACAYANVLVAPGVPAVSRRLAARLRVELDDVPCPIVLSAGMTANVTGLTEAAPAAARAGARMGADTATPCGR